MSTKLSSRISAPVALIVFLIGVASIAGAGLWILRSKGNQDIVKADNVMPVAARLDRLDGDVGIGIPGSAQNQSTTQWIKGSVNAPVSTGKRIYVKGRSRAAIAFSGRNYARLNPNTSLDVLALADRRTQLALREGSGIFDVGALAPNELFEIGTPYGAVDCAQPGLYEVGIDNGNVLVSVLSGLARVVGLAGSSEVSKGQLLTLGAAAASEAYLSQLSPTLAGSICDDYYSYRYPSTYDGRYADYNTYLDDPYYYDPYRRSVSYQYIPDDSEVAGLDDLNDYGVWSDVPGYGHCWHPQVSSGWAPYRDGSWSNDYPLGLTWVSNERWGWAPYHYGRWANVNQDWYWVPSEVVTRPIYAPALVAFVDIPEPDRVGWLPLGPGDPYVPRYYDQSYQPHYLGTTTVINKYVNVTNIVNYNVPDAWTVVPTSDFAQVITPRIVQPVDPAWLARTRPVVEPFAVPTVRELAPNIMAVKPTMAVPVTVIQAGSQPVVTSQPLVVPSAAADTVAGLKVQPVPEAAVKHKLQVNNTGQVVAATQPNGLPVPAVPPQAKGGQQPGQPNQSVAMQDRQARIDQLATEAAQGNKAAKQEMRQLQEQQRIQEKMDRKAAAQQAGQQAPVRQAQEAEQAQQAEQRKAEKQAARQQAQQADQQRQEQAAQLAATQRAQKQAARQQAQQQAEQAAAQQEQQRQQEKAQRKAAAQQQQVQQDAAQQQQRQQEKARRKAAQQQQPQPPNDQATTQQEQRQQQKAQRRAEQQQQAQQQAQQAPAQQEQRQQLKAQRRAEQQQQAQQQAQQAPAQQEQRQQLKAQRRAEQQQQAQQQAQQDQQQRQQQKAERRAERQNASQQQNPQPASPSKAEKKAKNKNSNQQ